MKIYSIWSEGFQATGESGTATLLGTKVADTFREACDLLAEEDASFKSYYNPQSMTYWGCRLFDNEMAARRSFG